MAHADDCVILLQYMEASGQQSLRKMQAETGIPFSTIREYIKPDVLVFKTWEQILKMRENPKSYSYYKSTIQAPNKKGAKINISKFGYLQHYGMKYGFFVYYSKQRNVTYVEKIPDASLWQLV